MDRASYFINNRALFGSFPTQQAVNELESRGVKFFINLTNDNEKKITPYKTTQNYISFPIPDRRIPQNWKKFSVFIIKVSNIIRNLELGKELLYIHCKGGHGRSGVVVACLLCYIFNMKPYEALEHTTRSHSNRSVMREKWRKIGSPQTVQQKDFVHKFFNNLYFYRAYIVGYTAGFSNFTPHTVTIDGYVFPTAEAAIQAMKNPTDKNYVESQIAARSAIISRNLGRKTKLRDDWEVVRKDLMKKIIKLKFDQHESIKKNLLNTGFRPIIQNTRIDSYWGIGNNGLGSNIFGEILSEIRQEYYLNQ